MIERLAEFLWHQQYGVQKTNFPNVRILYKADTTEIRVIVLFDMEGQEQFTLEQYQHILKQVEEAYYQKGYLEVKVLSLLCGNVIEVMKPYCQENQYTHWIVNTATNRLVVFENQPQRFAEVRSQLEELLIGPLHTVNPEYTDPVYIKKNHSGGFFQSGSTNTNALKRWLAGKPVCTIALITINIVIFLLMKMKALHAVVPDSYQELKVFFDWGATSYSAIVVDNEIYRLFTALFLHANFQHLMNNMLMLAVVGYMLESNFGCIRFLIIYFVAGIVANVGSVFYFHEIGENVIGLGASGAIFGVIGGFAYLVVRYRGKGFDVSAKRFLLFLFVTVYGGFRSQGQVDNIAHIVGFFIGILACILLDTIRRNQKMG